MRKALVLLTLGLLPVFAAQPGTVRAASPPPGTVYVDDDDPTCGGKSPCFATLQAAIVFAAAGDKIKVAPGTYDEVGQIVIAKDLSIEGDKKNPPVFHPTADTGSSGDLRGWFLQTPGTSLELKNLVLDGTGFKVFQAIRSRGMLKVDKVDFMEIKFNESGPTYSGLAIAIFGGDPGLDLVLKKSTLSEIGRIGVLVFGAGTDAVIEKNTYTGKGDGDFLDYAFEVGGGASAEIKGNKISGNRGVASSDGSTSAGLLVTTFFGPGTNASIEKNSISECTTGIVVGFGAVDTSVITATDNKIFDNEGSGIILLSDFNTLEKNKLEGNEDGITLDGAIGNMLKKNDLKKNTRYGINLSGDMNVLDDNKVKESGSDGFFVDASSSGNTFTKNKSEKNGGFGFKDMSSDGGTSGTANTYTDNKCKKNADGSSDPAGLCK